MEFSNLASHAGWRTRSGSALAAGNGSLRFSGASGGGGGDGGKSGEVSFSEDGGGDPYRLLRLLAIVFAVLVAAGGVLGYKKKGSVASLKASGVVAAAHLGAALLLGGSYTPLALSIVIGSDGALAAYMIKSYQKTKKPFPGIPVALFSAVNVLLFGKALVQGP